MKISPFCAEKKIQLLEIFLLVNIAFLALDIWVAHSVNKFHHSSEWIPFYYSIIGTLILLPTAINSRFQPTKIHYFSGAIVGWAGVIIGLLGLFYHLESQFFQEFSISSLVYTAPFLAPLAFTGIGFLLMLNRSIIDLDLDWHRWVILFALGGFIGNFGLSLCDHAQNAFFHWTEWIPVYSSAFGISVLTTSLFVKLTKQWLSYVNFVMGIQIVIGIIGFILHFKSNVNGASENVYQNFIYGSPIFAPLLFIDLSILALIATLSYQPPVVPKQHQ